MVLVPIATPAAFAQSRGSVERTHEVRQGETLVQIARRYGLTVAEVERASGLEDGNRIRVGQELKIPSAEATSSERPSSGSPGSAQVVRAGVRVTVEAGQTLSEIAALYGVRISDIRRANDLADADSIRVGQRLLVPEAREVRGAQAETTTITVEQGQTLSDIASANGTMVDELVEINDISDPDRLRVGQSLLIPSRGAAAATSARVTSGGVRVTLERGQTLSDVSATYGVRLSTLLRANRIEDANAVRAGQSLLVPGATQARAVARQRTEAPGSRPIVFYRIHFDEELTARLFDGRGRLRSGERERIDRLMRDRSTGRQHRTSVELLRLLQSVADRWPGKRLMIYSGFRPFRRSQHTPKSNHNIGRAVDFQVEGVSNRELRDFCRTLPSAGVGYYPNSWFVHVDVRDERAYWVDYSHPGEAPRYGREDRPPEGEAVSDVEATTERSRPRQRTGEGASVPVEPAVPEAPDPGEGEGAAGRDGGSEAPPDAVPAAGGAGALRSVGEDGGPPG